MNTLEGRAWQALAGIKGLGPKALWSIAGYLSIQGRTASWLLKNPDKAQEALGRRGAGIVLPDPDLQPYQEDAAAREREATFLHPLHPSFPARVKARSDRLPLPAFLYAAGNAALLERPGVAIVGRRDADQAALAAAERLAAQLAGAGITITSGYASGVDAAAHLGALRSGGTTIAVLAEGLGRFQVRPEFKEVVTDENTLVVSQFAWGDRWAAYQAMARNKLVAALADALVVVVAGAERDASGRMSGTFAAGLSALALGLPVFAVDPSFYSAPPLGNRDLLARGCLPWDPCAGAAPILAAIQAARKKRPGQLKLF
ncbi:MAG: DNA-processing protein DprA [Acidobacteria bacterium]|jgi:DNA protecting protein DprA|nr:DNA-processing protein DprA [Acidobacteriota bacterium]